MLVIEIGGRVDLQLQNCIPPVGLPAESFYPLIAEVDASRSQLESGGILTLSWLGWHVADLEFNRVVLFDSRALGSKRDLGFAPNLAQCQRSAGSKSNLEEGQHGKMVNWISTFTLVRRS